jgi:methylphosphotriester-DNA--protein-cysteine methyltransferase
MKYADNLLDAIAQIPAKEREQRIASALRKIEQDERRQQLEERFASLSTEDMETALSYKKIGE